jgi:hypothetical protein
MAVILSLLGIVLAAAGVAAVGFGIPINEFTLGTTLVLAGTTALAGGLILIGLAAVVAELGRVTAALQTRVVARPTSRPAEAAERVAPPAPSSVAAPAPSIVASPAPVIAATARPAEAEVPPRLRHEAPLRDVRPSEAAAVPVPSAVDVSSTAIERLRSSIPRTERPKAEPSLVTEHEDVPLSPNGAGHQRAQPSQPSAAQDVPSEPKVAAADRAGGAAVDVLKASRLDFLFRSKPARATTPPENFDAFWPAERRAGKNLLPESGSAADEGQVQSADESVSIQDVPLEPPTTQEPGATAILKSGVVEGMAYTLYADGSIEAELPNGRVRFGSIAELRAHIESNS